MSNVLGIAKSEFCNAHFNKTLSVSVLRENIYLKCLDEDVKHLMKFFLVKSVMHVADRPHVDLTVSPQFSVASGYIFVTLQILTA